VEEASREKVLNRIERCAILRMYRTGMYDKAVKQQKELLSKEEQTENIDNRYITELLFELAHYQLKAGQIDELLITLKEITNNDPSPFIKKECAGLLARAKKELSSEENAGSPTERENRKQKTMKCIELKESIEKPDNSESDLEEAEEGVMEHNVFEFERCLEIDDNFGEFDYVN
jgi:hypothetical protein